MVSIDVFKILYKNWLRKWRSWGMKKRFYWVKLERGKEIIIVELKNC